MKPGQHRIFVGQDPHKFHAAHMTVRPDGSKERLHGHTYHVTVAIDLADATFAHFLDLGHVKRALDVVCGQLNEHLLLPGENPHFHIQRDADGELEFTLCGRRYVVPRDEALVLPVDNVIIETLTQLVARRLVDELGPALAHATGVEVQITEVRGQGGAYCQGL